MLGKVESLEDNVLDYEGTISQFRELVLSLQGSVFFLAPSSLPPALTPHDRDLETLREHQATKESESQSLTSQSQAMLNLNLKLQSTVLKSQVKTIELELRKLEAAQALEHLAITKVSLSRSYRAQVANEAR